MPDNYVKDILHKYLGAPYKHGGRGMDGLDCWGLILRVYADLGYKLWDLNEEYDEGWKWKEKSLFIENYHRQWEKVEKPSVLDAVLFIGGNGVANHVGIIIDQFSFIHAARNCGVVRVRLSDNFWKPKIEGYYHLKEMTR